MKRYVFWASSALLMCSLSHSPSVHAASIVLDRDEFVTMLSHVETLKKRLGIAERQVKLHAAATAERNQLITLQEKHLAELEEIVKKGEEINTSHEEIRVAVTNKLDEIERDLTKEKRLSRYKSYALLAGVLFILAR